MAVEAKDRRTVIRYPRQLPVALETLEMAGTSPWLGHTRDISAEGASLVLPRRFEPGTLVSITISDRLAAPITLLARVLRAETLENGLWLLACRFPRPIEIPELEDLIQVAPATGRSAETRTPEQSPTHRLDLKRVREKLKQLACKVARVSDSSGSHS